MSFSYNFDSPLTRDKLRLLISDTDPSDNIFEDEELDIFLNLEDSNLNLAAARACRSIAMSRARQAIVVKVMGDISIDKSKVSTLYMNLADKFESREINSVEEYWDCFSVEVDRLGIDSSEYVKWEDLS
jgi:hypothetical protein